MTGNSDRTASQTMLRPRGPSRTLPGRSLRILARQQAAMLKEPEAWDGMSGVSIIGENPDLACEPLSVRKALAIRRVLLAMPIQIASDELIVGDWRVTRVEQARLPDYTNDGEKAAFGESGPPQVAAMAGHNTADCDTLIKVGLKGIRTQGAGSTSSTERRGHPG
jgi:hypothetical protein